MLFETEMRLTRKAVLIRDQGAKKALDFALHISLTGDATQTRGPRAMLAVLHCPPLLRCANYNRKARADAGVPHLILWKCQYLSGILSAEIGETASYVPCWEL